MPGELVARALALRSVDKTARTVDFIASTDAIDSYDEIVEQDWILDRFLANPVILFGHNSRDLPIGSATRCEVVEANGRKQLECTIQLLTAAANPMAEQVWHSIQEGGLRAVSVGFMPGDYRFEKRNGVEVFVLSQNTLHEISVVPIPANPEALAKMRSKARAAAGSNHQPASRAATNANEEDMTEKEMQERVARADAEKALAEAKLADVHKELGDAKTALAASEGTITQLSADRDGFKARAEKAEASVIESEVDALVGSKITPAEKDTFVELRKSSPALFKKMVEQRPEMTLLKGALLPEAKGGSGNVTKTPAADASTELHLAVEHGGKDL